MKSVVLLSKEELVDLLRHELNLGEGTMAQCIRCESSELKLTAWKYVCDSCYAKQEGESGE